MTSETTKHLNWPPTKPSQEFPKFLQDRVDKFFCERVKNDWGGRHIMRGLIPDEHSIDISNNDYLSLSRHPSIAEAQVSSLLSQGNGDMKGSIFMHGENIHRTFELEMAKFLQAEDVLLCQSGWAANTGLIQSIANETTPIYIDLLAHMSLWEGIQSAGAKPIPIRHNDDKHLERQVQKYGQGVIVIDSVYSTNGDLCPLEEIVDIAEKYNCILIVDESHSLGTHGLHGEGIVAAMGLADRVHYRTSSMAKAFPGRGGIIACSSYHREYFIFESKPAIFSTALLPHDVHAYLAMIKIIRQECWRRIKLHRTANFIREELDKMGYNVTASKSQIVSLEAGTEQQTIILRDALEKNGIFASVFCAPATPKNRALMRFSLNASLSQEQAEKIVRVCHDIRKEVDMQNWPSTLRKENDVRKAKPISVKLANTTQFNKVSNPEGKLYKLPKRFDSEQNFAS